MQLTLSSPLIWIADGAVDFRKSIDGFIEIIKTMGQRNPREGIYVFYNYSRNKVKILAWHGNGFVLLLKRLERGCFTIVSGGDGFVQLAEKQLSWLLAGLDWLSMSNWNTLTYDNYY
jgi:transposase